MSIVRLENCHLWVKEKTAKGLAAGGCPGLKGGGKWFTQLRVWKACHTPLTPVSTTCLLRNFPSQKRRPGDREGLWESTRSESWDSDSRGSVWQDSQRTQMTESKRWWTPPCTAAIPWDRVGWEHGSHGGEMALKPLRTTSSPSSCHWTKTCQLLLQNVFKPPCSYFSFQKQKNKLKEKKPSWLKNTSSL